SVCRHSADVGERQTRFPIILFHDTPMHYYLRRFAFDRMPRLIIARGATAYRRVARAVNPGGAGGQVDGRCGPVAGVWYTRARSTAGLRPRSSRGMTRS